MNYLLMMVLVAVMQIAVVLSVIALCAKKMRKVRSENNRLRSDADHMSEVWATVTAVEMERLVSENERLEKLSNEQYGYSEGLNETIYELKIELAKTKKELAKSEATLNSIIEG